jgi:multidrug efflux pump
MVPVMVTAPSVIGASAKRLGARIAASFSSLGRLVGIGRRTAVTPEGVTVEIPPGADSTRKYFTKDGSGLVEREQDGVTIISRDAAE